MAKPLPDLKTDRATMVERIAAAVRESIMRGELAPGTPLRELELTDALGVARNTLREALRLLSQEGLIRHDAYRGTSVTELAHRDVADIFAVRRMVELAGVTASGTATPEQLDELPAARDAYDAAVDEEDWPIAFEQDMRLHATIVSFAGSDRLNRFFVGVLRELRLAYFLFGGFETEGLPRDRRQHAAIVERIAAGRRDDAASVLAAHLADSEALLMQLMDARLRREDAE